MIEQVLVATNYRLWTQFHMEVSLSWVLLVANCVLTDHSGWFGRVFVEDVDHLIDLFALLKDVGGLIVEARLQGLANIDHEG